MGVSRRKFSYFHPRVMTTIISTNKGDQSLIAFLVLKYDKSGVREGNEYVMYSKWFLMILSFNFNVNFTFLITYGSSIVLEID